MDVVRKIFNVITTLLVIVVVAFAVMIVGARLIGLKVYTVLSGSMVPTYNVGDLIYVKEINTDELKVGDAITFMLDKDTVATHRIVEIVENSDKTISFRTKGDANKVVDANPVHSKNVIGKPIFNIPYLGYVSNYIQTPPGMYVAIGVCALLVLMSFIPDLIFGKKDKKEIAE